MIKERFVFAMALLEILIAPDPRLKQKCVPVEEVTDRIRKLLDDMLETMYEAPGIGLAAPQVGVAKQIIVVDAAREGEKPNPLKMINPEIIWTSEQERTYEEGCLSVPDNWAEVVRPERIKVRYMDETGTTRELEADDLLATCIQHEIDHLNGVLFIDHISRLKRQMILRKLTKLKRA